KSYVNADEGYLVDRMLGVYGDGLGKTWTAKHAQRVYGAGAVNVPYLGDRMGLLTQPKRWGPLKGHVAYLDVAKQINRIAVYKQAAAAAGVSLPSSEMRSSTLIDGVIWDGSDPAAYADGFAVSATGEGSISSCMNP